MSNLNYKASNIARAERLYATNFFQALDSLNPKKTRMADLLFLIEAGGLSEEEAGEIVDEKGLLTSIELVAEALTEAGFLAKSKEVQEAKKLLKEAEDRKTSETIGDDTKA